MIRNFLRPFFEDPEPICQRPIQRIPTNEPRQLMAEARWIDGQLTAEFATVPLPNGRKVIAAYVQSNSVADTDAVFYRNVVLASHLLDYSTHGDKDSQDRVNPLYLFPGDRLLVVWPTATPGSTAQVTITYVPVG
jgi:hypothetical protein